MDRKIPDFSGTWKMKSSENFEELLKALGKSVSVISTAGSGATQRATDRACILHCYWVKKIKIKKDFRGKLKYIRERNVNNIYYDHILRI